MAGLLAPAAYAHDASSPYGPSAFWDVQTSALAGVSMNDPGIRVNTTLDRFYWDNSWNASCVNNNSPADGSNVIAYQTAYLDAAGVRLSPWGADGPFGANGSCVNSGSVHESIGLSSIRGSYPTVAHLAVRYVRFTELGSQTPSTYYGWGASITPADYSPPVPSAPQNFGMLSTSGGGKLLSYDQGSSLCFKYAWTTEQKNTECTAIMRQESSFRTKAVSYIGCCFGLLQIYASLHGVTEADMYDPDLNVDKARDIYVAAGSWQPWEAYTGSDGAGSDGAWLDWEEPARAAAKRQLACGGCAYDSIASAPSSSSGSVTLSWTAPATGCPTCVYEIERRQGTSGAWTTLREGITGLQFTDNGATDGTSYDYRAAATNNAGQGDWSSTASVTTGDPDPNSAVGGSDPDALANDDDGSNSGAGEDCWSINPLTVLKCALRWAFVPGEASFNAWSALYDNLSIKPPFSVALGALDWTTDFIGDTKDQFEQAKLGGEYDPICLEYDLPLDQINTELPTGCVGSTMVDIAQGEHETMITSLRLLAEMMVVVAATFAIWRIMRSGLGGTVEAKGAESVDDYDEKSER